jgi:hypothetical protein
LCLFPFSAHYSDNSFLVHHRTNRDDRHLHAHAMASDFTVTWPWPPSSGGQYYNFVNNFRQPGRNIGDFGLKYSDLCIKSVKEKSKYFCGKLVFLFGHSVAIKWRGNLPRLPDFSWYNIPKWGKIYQIIYQWITKLYINELPNYISINYQMAIKYTRWPYVIYSNWA